MEIQDLNQQLINGGSKATLRAAAVPTSYDPETGEVDCVFYTGTAVLRTPYFSEPYLLQLSTDPNEVRMTRINTGSAPVVKDHSEELEDTIGTVVAKSAMIGRDGKMRARLKLSQAMPEEERAKIADGTWRNLSVGAQIYQVRDVTEKGDSMKRILAIDWEPYHISLVSSGADPHAVLLQRETTFEALPALDDSNQEVIHMETNNSGQATAPVVDTAALTLAAQAAERARVSEILSLGAKAKLSADEINGFVANGATVEQVRNHVFDQLLQRSNQIPTLPGGSTSISIARDEVDTRREQMSLALAGRMQPTRFAVDAQNEYRGLSCVEMCREVLSRSGVSVRGKSDAELVTLALHSSSDFPNILANSMNKTLLAAYEYAQPTYKRWAKASTARDFKTMSRNRFGEFPALLAVGENGEIKHGTISESKESYAIGTYARKFGITRQAIINDDLNAMAQIPQAIGIQAAVLENSTVYSILTANAAMSDTVNLFDAAHGNTGTGAIGITGLDTGRSKMMVQKGLDGTTVLNIQPKFLIVPAARYTIAQQYTQSTGNTPNGVKPTQQSNYNPFAGMLEVVSDGVLDATSTAAFYMAADPEVCPTVEYAYLEGAAGPQLMRVENANSVLGVEFSAWLDFGAKAIDWRGLYYSTGS